MPFAGKLLASLSLNRCSLQAENVYHQQRETAPRETIPFWALSIMQSEVTSGLFFVMTFREHAYETGGRSGKHLATL